MQSRDDIKDGAIDFGGPQIVATKLEIEESPDPPSKLASSARTYSSIVVYKSPKLDK
jgi:hypothetical protein